VIARIIFWLLLALIALAPLPFGSNRPWSWSLLALGSAALLGVWTLAALVNPTLHTALWRHYRPLAVGFGLFILWTIFQAMPFSPVGWHDPAWQDASNALGTPLPGAISLSPDSSLTGVMRLLSYGIVFWLGLQLCRHRRRALILWWAICLTVTAYAVYGLVVQLTDSRTILWFAKWSYQSSLTSTFVNRNHFATYVGLGLLVTLALITEEVRNAAQHGLSTRTGLIYFLDHMRPPLFLLMVIFVVLATALLLTHSRAGALCAAFGVATLIGALALSQPFRSRTLVWFGGIIVLVGFAILFVSGNTIWSRMGDLVENVGAREQVYGIALRAIADRPWLGHGLGTFAMIFRLLRGEGFGVNEAIYDVAHNSYLEMAVEAGVPAALLLYALLAVMTAVFVRGAKTRRHDAIYSCTGLAATMLVGAHSLVDFSLQIPAIAATYFLMAGAAYAQSWRHEERVGAVAQRRE
jgi:O-antigen ligase